MLRAAITILAALLVLSGARAETYPTRPIQLIIPFDPGSSTDVVARAMLPTLSGAIGQSVFIVNKPGASGTLGAAELARAKPDGYTLLLGGGGALVINPIAGRTPYDPVKDFEPVALLVVHAFALAVHPSLPVRTLQELIVIQQAKHPAQRPQQRSRRYGAASIHFIGEFEQHREGFRCIEIVVHGIAEAPGLRKIPVNGRSFGRHRL